MAKNKYMIVVGASVVVVRDGKRKPIQPGGGDHFTEDEITAINTAVPGSLRTPINEGSGQKPGPDEEFADDKVGNEGSVDAEINENKTVVKTPKPKKTKVTSNPAKPTKDEQKADEGGDDDDDEDGDDADEDEDI